MKRGAELTESEALSQRAGQCVRASGKLVQEKVDERERERKMEKERERESGRRVEG